MTSQSFIGLACKVRTAVSLSRLPVAVKEAVAGHLAGAEDEQPVFVSVTTAPNPKGGDIAHISVDNAEAFAAAE